MVDSIHLIVRIDSIHLMANSIKGRLSKHLMVNSIKGRPFTIHHLTCNENCPPPSFSPITTPQAMHTAPPPFFFINHHFTKIANGTPPPLHQSPPENYRTCRKNENARKSPFGSFSNGHNHMYNVAQHTIVLRADSDMSLM